ncbi:MAG: 6-carboxytetrahydropterin synthase [Nitrospira sp.]
MPEPLLTKLIEFAAAHRYHHAAWDAATNRRVFGACNNEPGHGHNYLLEVTVAGPVDRRIGMVVNLFELKGVLVKMLEEFDHKHLNLDTPYFKQTIPTTENIARLLWAKLAGQSSIGRLERIRLHEDETLWVDLMANDYKANRARLTRRAGFAAALPAASRGQGYTGHNYAVEVTIEGDIHPETGMVTDLVTLDKTIQELVVARFADRNLDKDPAFAAQPLTGATFARLLWSLLAKAIPTGRLQKLRLVESDNCFYEYAEH